MLIGLAQLATRDSGRALGQFLNPLFFSFWLTYTLGDRLSFIMNHVLSILDHLYSMERWLVDSFLFPSLLYLRRPPFLLTETACEILFSYLLRN